MTKIAVVTGAAQGIGLAISSALLADGYKVVGVDVNEVVLAETAKKLDLLPMVADLTEPERVASLFRAVEAQFGGLDLLVNNAGTCLMSDFRRDNARGISATNGDKL